MNKLPRARDYLVEQGDVLPIDLEALKAQRARMVQQRQAPRDAEMTEASSTLDPDVAVLAMCEVPLPAAQSIYARYAASAALKEIVDRLPQKESRQDRSGGATVAEARAAEAAVFGAKQPDAKEAGKRFGARWLLEWCKRVIFLSGQSEQDDDAIATAAAQAVLDQGRNNELLGSDLFELLGMGVFEEMENLLRVRPSLMKNLNTLISSLREEETDAIEQAGASSSLSDTVSMMTESQRLLAKKGRRGGTRFRESDISNSAWLSRAGLFFLVEEEDRRENADKFIKLGGVEFRLGQGVGGPGGQRGLPVGTSRKAYKTHEEITVPATKPAVPPPDEKLVNVSELPDWARPTFAGFERLNRIQSRIFPTAFHSNENILVCAPTGAGKTNIAMISVLREISHHVRNGKVQSRDFKIIYVAPMKALAAEVTGAFARRLAPLGLCVRELTGDMQLTRREIAETQMIVTTPEKWDVITRKGGEAAVAAAVRLLILDEVHLLNDERGPVIETLVARTQRQVEASQRMIRIVGLSATLPNYQDVAEFLGVNSTTGCFYFDASYRPVPLETRFVGVTEKNHALRKSIMEDVAYDKVLDSLKRGFQAMVFVHSRKDTGKTARGLIQRAQQAGDTAVFDCSQEEAHFAIASDMKKSRNRELTEVFESGFGIHHAGMLRSDRTLVEDAFSRGAIKVLCCTATLAWGVNLPAHTVIIKGTQLYNPAKGGFTDLGMLDVQQIFGRAGRPQYQDTGEAVIITTHDKLAHYLGMLTHQTPIESQFVERLPDHLNAELVLGTVSNIAEAVRWLSYTYLYTRMRKNPLPYGLTWEELMASPALEGARRRMVTEAARQLQRCRMLRFDEESGAMHVTDMGRVASHFYIAAASIEVFNERLAPHLDESQVLAAIARSKEFDNLAVREDEGLELEFLARSVCLFDIHGTADSKHGKACILLQAYISRARIDSFSLVADVNYTAQNAGRIARALFEICLRKGWSPAADVCLAICKCFERRMWPDAPPLWQYENVLKYDLIREAERAALSMPDLKAMTAVEIGDRLKHPAAGPRLHEAAAWFPTLEIEVLPHPVTRTVLQLVVQIVPSFQWKTKLHGGALKWHIWVEDPQNENIYYAEQWMLHQGSISLGAQTLEFAVPIFEPLPDQYFVRVLSDEWLGAETLVPVPLKNLILPVLKKEFTELLNVPPLPTDILSPDAASQHFFPFSHFNRIQTQCFHAAFHTDSNLLITGPVGSGLASIAELALLRGFKQRSSSKVLWFVPLAEATKRRMASMEERLKSALRRTISIAPDLGGDVILCQPSEWLDGLSEDDHAVVLSQAALIVLEDLQLLGNKSCGAVYEAAITRLRLAQVSRPRIRLVGLAAALANATDVGSFLGVPEEGLFNFPPAARPLPLECHIQGFQGQFYVSRMGTMNRPIYTALNMHAPSKPAIIYVSSRRQSRVTALDLINFAAAEGRQRTFLSSDATAEIEYALASVQDSALAHSLQFGIVLYHEALDPRDRSLVERLFLEGHAKVMVATYGMAWAFRPLASLVVVKGTEYCDAVTERYLEYPLTDVLQMIGQAGRPGMDDRGVAVVMVFDPLKSYYKKCLYEPLMVESHLVPALPRYLLAEIERGFVGTRQQAVHWLTWTFFGKRLLQNPSYYDLTSREEGDVASFLSRLVDKALNSNLTSRLVETKNGGILQITPLGSICVRQALEPETALQLRDSLQPGLLILDALHKLAALPEFHHRLRPRYNDDKLVSRLTAETGSNGPGKIPEKCHGLGLALLQAWIGRTPLHMADLRRDQTVAVEMAQRLLKAIFELLASEQANLITTISWLTLSQSLHARMWWDRALSNYALLSEVATLLQLRGASQLAGEDKGSGNKKEKATEKKPKRGNPSFVVDIHLVQPSSDTSSHMRLIALKTTMQSTAGKSNGRTVAPSSSWAVVSCNLETCRLFDVWWMDEATDQGSRQISVDASLGTLDVLVLDSKNFGMDQHFAFHLSPEDEKAHDNVKPVN